jgi:hypothetical protein
MISLREPALPAKWHSAGKSIVCREARTDAWFAIGQRWLPQSAVTTWPASLPARSTVRASALRIHDGGNALTATPGLVVYDSANVNDRQPNVAEDAARVPWFMAKGAVVSNQKTSRCLTLAYAHAALAQNAVRCVALSWNFERRSLAGSNSPIDAS